MQGGPHVQSLMISYRDLDRVEVLWPDTRQPTQWDELATHSASTIKALVIVNRKRDARELVQQLPDALYLSTDLCGAHRAERIAEIRARLAANRDRTKAGFPWIAAACREHATHRSGRRRGFSGRLPGTCRARFHCSGRGRCNREGWLMHGGITVQGWFMFS
jgi:CRISPR-associated endonuclease/helicase Cas3